MKYLSFILILVLVCVIVFNHKEVEVKEFHTTDTIVVFRTDTITEIKPVHKFKKIVDTFYVYIDGCKIELPKESKHYSKTNAYDVWVSGYMPSLDSIKTYNKTEFKTITNETIRDVCINKSSVYVFGGFESLQGSFHPTVGISISTKKSLYFTADIGIFKGKPSYGFGVGYKLK